MGKKTGRNQQRSTAKKKRRANRLKKRSSVAGGIDDYRGNLSSADEYVMNMSDKEFDEYLANLRPTFPEEVIEKPRKPFPLPMWDYDDRDIVEVFQEKSPGITEEEGLNLLFSQPVRVRFINSPPGLIPAYVILKMDEHATGPELLAEAKRWHDDKRLWWHVAERTHIVPLVNPSGPMDPEDMGLDELSKFVV